MTEADTESGLPANPSPLDLALRWPGKLLEEVLLMPWTLSRVRRSLTALPGEIETLTRALNVTTDLLDTMLPAVERTLAAVASNAEHLDAAVGGLAGDLTSFRETLESMLPELSRLVGGMDDRVQHVEAMVSELGDALLNLMGAIPGVRRAIRER